MRRAHGPFALCNRGGAGKAMVYFEVILALVKMLSYFDFKKASGEAGELGQGEIGGVPGRRGRKEEFQMYDVVTADHDGPILTFSPRGEIWRELAEMLGIC